MRRLTVLPLLFLVSPVALAAQSYGEVNPVRNSHANESLSDIRRLEVLPTLTVGFRVVGDAAESRTLRVSTGHLVNGRLYHATAFITPRDGSSPRRAEGTISADAPGLEIGILPAGEYTISVHLEDIASGATRDARNKVVLR